MGEPWLTVARATFSGREIFLQQLFPTLRVLPTRTSRATLVRLSMISTRLLTRCSLTCHRVTTRREPSTGLPQRLSAGKEDPEVEGLIEKGKISLDLYEILGVCTWVE